MIHHSIVQQCDLGVVGHLTSTLVQIYCWVCLERIFLITPHLAKLWGRSRLPQTLWALGHCPAERWRTRLRSDVWRAATVVTASSHDSVTDKCQTGAMSTTCYSPTDAISDWTLIVCTGVLLRRLSSWLMEMHSVVILWVSMCGRCEYLFVSEQKWC